MVQSREKINFVPVSIAIGSNVIIFCAVSVENSLHPVDTEMIRNRTAKIGVEAGLQGLNRLGCVAAPKTDEKSGPGVQQI